MNGGYEVSLQADYEPNTTVRWAGKMHKNKYRKRKNRRARCDICLNRFYKDKEYFDQYVSWERIRVCPSCSRLNAYEWQTIIEMRKFWNYRASLIKTMKESR